jgi:hypothetical protein
MIDWNATDTPSFRASMIDVAQRLRWLYGEHGSPQQRMTDPKARRDLTAWKQLARFERR